MTFPSAMAGRGACAAFQAATSISVGVVAFKYMHGAVGMIVLLLLLWPVQRQALRTGPGSCLGAELLLKYPVCSSWGQPPAATGSSGSGRASRCSQVSLLGLPDSSLRDP